MKVKTTAYRGGHNYAQCLKPGCDWNEDHMSTGGNAKLIYQIKKHVKKTGHKVVRETANSFYYELE